MNIFQPVDKNQDDRRSLMAFRLPPGFPNPVEVKIIITKKENVMLGNHSHPYPEGFLLVSGSVIIETWTPKKGKIKKEISAPAMLELEAGEEHVFTCLEGTILIGFMPEIFSQQNLIPATNLSK